MGERPAILEIIPSPPLAQELREVLVNKPSKQIKKLITKIFNSYEN